MQIFLESLDSITLRLRFILSAKTVDEALAKQLQELANNPDYFKRLKTLRGASKLEVFTADKTPAHLIKQCFDDIAPIALDNLINSLFKQVVREKELTPFGSPVFDV